MINVLVKAAIGAVAILLVIARYISYRKARKAEQAFMVLAQQADALAKTGLRGGLNHEDPLARAKAQFRLGELVTARDGMESRYDQWTSTSEHLTRTIARLKQWLHARLCWKCGMGDATITISALSILAPLIESRWGLYIANWSSHFLGIARQYVQSQLG